MSLLENRDAAFEDLINAHEVPDYFTAGITGPPGAGKSTLIDGLLNQFNRDEKIAILATDPSSPYTGGALLGDRHRLTSNKSNNIYYRSLASRGSRGSLASVSRLATRLLAIAGYQWIIYETIGSGQNEIDIRSLAKCILLILVPEAGDKTQTMKSGIIELADIIAINKSDRPGAQGFKEEMEESLQDRKHHRDNTWLVPVIACSASENQGLDKVFEALNKHKDHCNTHPQSIAEQHRIKHEITDILLEHYHRKIREISSNKWEELIRAFQENPANLQKFVQENLDISL